jgi:hypothetical protein
MSGSKDEASRKLRQEELEEEKAEEADEESFPASDPPSTSPVVGAGGRKPKPA